MVPARTRRRLLSLAATGLLKALLDKGFRYVFLSNADNLGATCDPRIAAWLVENDVPYVAEVCDRTVNDRKGGHLAVRKSDGQLVLRDSAMVEKQDEEQFQDYTRHTTFFTPTASGSTCTPSTRCSRRAASRARPASDCR